MKTKNEYIEKLAKTFETRLLKAVLSNDNKEIEKMIIEAELLYKEEYITESEFNTMTDIELIKEIYA